MRVGRKPARRYETWTARQAVRGRKRDVYFGFPESLFVRINAIFPRLVDGALSANDRKAARLFTR